MSAHEARLEFDALEIPPGKSLTFSKGPKPGRRFRGHGLIARAADLSVLSLEALFVGTKTQRPASSPSTPLLVYAQTASELAARLMLDTCRSGEQVHITVKNTADVPVTVSFEMPGREATDDASER